MNRAGREPAEDAKRRLVAACQEVGLEVIQARMHLIREAAARIVLVEAKVPERKQEHPTVSLMTAVKVSGDWPRVVDIRCNASHEDPMNVNGPWMKGRDRVPINEVIDQLMETLEERNLVISAATGGIPGPYRFKRSVWDKVDPLKFLEKS